MSALGIRREHIQFKACKGGHFKVTPASVEHTGQYVITYPLEPVQSYIAPITHELAHVLQMEAAGGFGSLRSKIGISKRIELGADYLAGIVYAHTLNRLQFSQFQHDVSLLGLYVELDANAHGSPSERAVAFRFGFFSKFEKLNHDFRLANDDFQANIYPHVVEAK